MNVCIKGEVGETADMDGGTSWQHNCILIALIKKKPGNLLKDFVDFVSQRNCVTASRFAVFEVMKRNDITCKGETRANMKFNVGRGQEFLADIRDFYSTSFASLGEMSVMLNVAPLYGASKRGQRAVIPQPGRRKISYMLTLFVCPQGICTCVLQADYCRNESLPNLMNETDLFCSVNA